MSSRLRAATVALLGILVLATGIVPACAGAMCCMSDTGAVLHRAMPCCDEPTIASGDVAQVLPAAPAVPQIALAAAPIEAPSVVPAAPSAALSAVSLHHETDPPLFLLNEQFRI